MKTANEIQAAMVELVCDYVKGNPMPGLLHRRQYNGGYRSIGVNMNGTASITQFTEKWEVDVETPFESIHVEWMSIIDLAYLITEINYQKAKS